jgi:hypothetical protein
LRDIYKQAVTNELGQAKLTAALAASRRDTHEKFTAAVDKGTGLTNEEERVAFRYHFSCAALAQWLKTGEMPI